MTDDSSKQWTTNVLIPEGLINNVRNNIYNHSNRDNDFERARRQTLDPLQQPARALLPNRLIFRSRTPDLNANGRIQTGPRRTPSSALLHPISSQNQSRAHSVNVASVLRRQQRWDSTALPPSPFRNIPSEETNDDLTITSPLGRISVCPPDQIPHQHIRRSSSIARPEPLLLYIAGDEPQENQPASENRRKTAISKRISDASVAQPRRGTVWETYQRAKSRQQELQRSKAFQYTFEYFMYLLLILFVYFVLVGRPLWGGVVWYIYVLFGYHLTFVGGSAIFIGLAFFYAFGPLLVSFERPAPMPDTSFGYGTNSEKPYFPPAPFIRVSEDEHMNEKDEEKSAGSSTALLVPCYKSAKLLPDTLEAALKIFPPSSIFILANGNSPTPLDNTEEVCKEYGVNHIWIPIGSKIVAQYVGAYLARTFPYALLIDDDCLLPPNFPIVTERLKGRVKVLGYTLTSIGTGRTRGTWCQQAQDLEYKLSGLQRLFAGKIGSATFPHGAIVLWDTEFLIQTFKEHPGFSVSEDWFFGHVARVLGSRTIMCSSVFVETETPSSLFFASGGARGGFGEMTVFKQRFKRWNFFFVNGCYYNLMYILCSWKLGFWEPGAKIFVFQEIYETLLYLITPIVLPISFVVRPAYTAYLFAGTLAMYLIVSVIFNEVQLRLASRGTPRNMMVNRWMLVCYYMPFKIALTAVNVASCWWSLWKYAKYFAQRHPRIVEDENAVGLVLRIEEEKSEKSSMRSETPTSIHSAGGTGLDGRRLTATAIKVNIIPSSIDEGRMGRDSVSPTALDGREDECENESRFNANRQGSTTLKNLNDGLKRQLQRWTPVWRENMNSPAPGSHRLPSPLGQIVEVLDEEEYVAGYSYYGT